MCDLTEGLHIAVSMVMEIANNGSCPGLLINAHSLLKGAILSYVSFKMVLHIYYRIHPFSMFRAEMFSCHIAYWNKTKKKGRRCLDQKANASCLSVLINWSLWKLSKHERFFIYELSLLKSLNFNMACWWPLIFIYTLGWR